MYLPFKPTHMLRVFVRTEYELAWCSMFHSHYADMQHDYIQKKNVLTFEPTKGVEGVRKDRIIVCACMVLYFQKKMFCHFNPTPGV